MMVKLTQEQKNMKAFIKYLRRVPRSKFDITNIDKCVQGHGGQFFGFNIREVSLEGKLGVDDNRRKTIKFRQLCYGGLPHNGGIYPRRTPKGCANWLEKYCLY